MNIELIMVSVVCAVSLLNLLSTVFLSNAIFRLLTIRSEDKIRPTISGKEGGLVDLPETSTYDPRFRR